MENNKTMIGKVLDNGIRVEQELGEGQFSNVNLGINQKEQKYALKFFKENNFKTSEQSNQIKALEKLRNKNIITLLEATDQCNIFPLMENGELFNYVGKFPEESKEKIVRYYFKQLIEAVDHMFSCNIVHRDLQLQNILVDSDYDLKICDFGFAYFIDEASSGSMDVVSGEIGTSNYMAPEIFTRKSYSAKKADIFSLGVILFSLYSGFPPYAQAAVKSDPYYKFFIDKQNFIFWNALQRKFGLPYTDDFINLIDSMMNSIPQQRLSLEQIKSHPWLKGDVITQQELKTIHLQIQGITASDSSVA